MAVSTSSYQSMTTYQRDIDRWIIRAYRVGAQDFWHLVSMLPAVYPTVVQQAVERLIAASSIPAHLAVERPTWIPAVHQVRRFLACQPQTHLPAIGVTLRIPQGAFGTGCCID